MANPQNLVSLATRSQQERTEIARKGQKATTEIRRKKASIRDSLNKILTSGFKLPEEVNDVDIDKWVKKLNSIGVDTKNMELTDLINCGQILSAIGGNANNYRVLLEANGENIIEQEEINHPKVKKIQEIVDNSDLEGVIYEENRLQQDAKGK